MRSSPHTPFEAEPAFVSGLSLAAGGSAFAPPSTGQRSPARIFKASRNLSLARSVIAPSPGPVCPAPHDFLTITRCQLCVPAIPTVPDFHSPPRIAALLRIIAFHPFQSGGSPVQTPVFLSLPGTGFAHCAAPDHRSRIVTFSLACCSTSPLELIAVCGLRNQIVNDKFVND